MLLHYVYEAAFRKKLKLILLYRQYVSAFMRYFNDFMYVVQYSGLQNLTAFADKNHFIQMLISHEIFRYVFIFNIFIVNFVEFSKSDVIFGGNVFIL